MNSPEFSLKTLRIPLFSKLYMVRVKGCAVVVELFHYTL